MQGGNAGTWRRWKNNSALLAETRRSDQHYPHYRFQRRVAELQDNKVHGVGRGRTIKAAQPVDALFRQSTSVNLRGGQFW